MKNEITSQDLTSLIDIIEPHTNEKSAFTAGPFFSSERKDACAMIRTTGDITKKVGWTLGYFDMVYLIWKNDKGLNHEEIENTEGRNDYAFIDYVTEHDGDIDVAYNTGKGNASMCSCGPEHYRKSKKEMGLD